MFSNSSVGHLVSLLAEKNKSRCFLLLISGRCLGKRVNYMFCVSFFVNLRAKSLSMLCLDFRSEFCIASLPLISFVYILLSTNRDVQQHVTNICFKNFFKKGVYNLII